MPLVGLRVTGLLDVSSGRLGGWREIKPSDHTINTVPASRFLNNAVGSEFA
jgi:hypothetical protein